MVGLAGVEHTQGLNLDSSLLIKFPLEGHDGSLPQLDAAAWEIDEIPPQETASGEENPPLA
jgi:hypothetical protein